MRKFALFLLTMSLAGWSQAALKPGDSLSPYTIHNVANGKEYCQVCAYGAKPAKLIEFGKLKDEAFWTDLEKIQKLYAANPSLGVFAHVIDSQDADAVKAEAARHGITFPVVVTSEKDWDKKYKVKGVSRTIYYAQQKNNIVWTAKGLDDKAVEELSAHVKKDLAS